MDLILMMIALFAVMYFLMIRPQQKRAKQHQEMQSGLSAGERVLLTSGMFGTVAHVGERQIIATPELESAYVETAEGAVARAEADAAADSFFQDRTAEPRAEDTK